jgi:hypothetical protein
LVVEEIVGISRFGIQNIGKKLKIKTLAHQLGSRCFRFSVGIRIQFRQNSVIFAQFIINIAHIIRTILIYFVVVGIPTPIAAEFLVFATHNSVSTFEAGFSHGFCVLKLSECLTLSEFETLKGLNILKGFG